MNSKLVICGVVAASAVIFAGGCSRSEPTANSSANANSNATVTIDPNNMPPGLSASPILPSSNSTPGIPPPGQANSFVKGPTPIPGIPDQKTLNKPFKPGATPTPGIPDEETLRRQMRQPVSNINTAPPTDSPLMMRGRKRPAAAPSPE